MDSDKSPKTDTREKFLERNKGGNVDRSINTKLQ